MDENMQKTMDELMKKMQQYNPELRKILETGVREKTTFEIARIFATSVTVLADVTDLTDKERFTLVTEVLENCALTARKALEDGSDLTPEEEDKARKIIKMFMD